MSLSLSGRKVLLIDGDFRGSNADFYGLSKDATTLVDILTTSNRPLKVASAAGGAFDVIPAGTPTGHVNSCALLSSEQMYNLIEKCREVYDFTIFDLPAQLPVADARAVGHVIDDYILVVEWDKTNRNAVRRAVELIQEVGGSIIGCVFNKVDERAYYREEGLIGANGYDQAFSSHRSRLKPWKFG
jgi:succinoglycan biosynthesis transport protein ExoP